MTVQEMKTFRWLRDKRGWSASAALDGARAETEAEASNWRIDWEADDLPFEDCFPDHDDFCPDYRRACFERNRSRLDSCPKDHEIYCAVLRAHDDDCPKA